MKLESRKREESCSDSQRTISPGDRQELLARLQQEDSSDRELSDTPEPSQPFQSSFVKPDVHLPVASGWRRILYFCLAGLFVALGTLGALLPVLPATPFLLLASFFLLRTSPKLNQALLKSRFFGPILVDWQVHGGVRNHIKVKSVITVLIAVGISLYFAGDTTWKVISILSLASIGIAVVCRLPKARD